MDDILKLPILSQYTQMLLMQETLGLENNESLVMNSRRFLLIIKNLRFFVSPQRNFEKKNNNKCSIFNLLID